MQSDREKIIGAFRTIYSQVKPCVIEILDKLDPRLLQPKVSALCCSDDRQKEVEFFDATLWFALVKKTTLRALLIKGFRGNELTDSIGRIAAEYDEDVRELFDYMWSRSSENEERGFECEVNVQETWAWFIAHRDRWMENPSSETEFAQALEWVTPSLLASLPGSSIDTNTCEESGF